MIHFHRFPKFLLASSDLASCSGGAHPWFKPIRGGKLGLKLPTLELLWASYGCTTTYFVNGVFEGFIDCEISNMELLSCHGYYSSEVARCEHRSVDYFVLSHIYI